MPDHSAYLDYNASAPLRPEARAALVEALGCTGNASSVHGPGRRVKALLDKAREEVAALLGAAPGNVVFTSGATEANILALRGLAGGPGGGHVIYSAIEHDAVRAPLAALGLPSTVLGAGRGGAVDLEAFVEAAAGAIARGERPLVALMLANNETGVLQPVQALGEALRALDAPASLAPILFCDGAQGVGKIPVSFPALGVHALSVSGHKFGAPQGTGALLLAEGVAPRPQALGGGQESRRRAGTEASAAIAGFGAAAAAVRAELATGEPGRVRNLRDGLERRVRSIAPDAALFGDGAERIPNTAAIGLRGISAETQVIALDLAGVAVSAGAACSSGKVTRSSVLSAMGVEECLAGSAIRVSLGWASTQKDVDRFITAYSALAARAGGDMREEMTV